MGCRRIPHRDVSRDLAHRAPKGNTSLPILSPTLCGASGVIGHFFSSAAWDIGFNLVYGVLATCAALACASGLGRLVVAPPSVSCIADRERSRRTRAADMLGLNKTK